MLSESNLGGRIGDVRECSRWTGLRINSGFWTVVSNRTWSSSWQETCLKKSTIRESLTNCQIY